MRPSRAAPTRRAESTTSRFSPRCWLPLGRHRRAALPVAIPRPRLRSRIPSRPVAPLLAKLALLSLPVMGYWALFLSHEQPYLRQVRFAVAMGGVAVLAFVVFLKQHLLDQTASAAAQPFAPEFRQPPAAAGQGDPASQAGFARRIGRARRRRTGVPALGHPDQFRTHGRQQQPEPRATLATRRKSASRPGALANWSAICSASPSRLREKRILLN